MFQTASKPPQPPLTSKWPDPTVPVTKICPGAGFTTGPVGPDVVGPEDPILGDRECVHHFSSFSWSVWCCFYLLRLWFPLGWLLVLLIPSNDMVL